MKEETYILKNINSFNPIHIFECGQCFRWNKEENGSYTGVVGKNVINVNKKDGKHNFLVFTIFFSLWIL